MKKLLVVIAIVLSNQLLAQMPKDPETGKFMFKDIIEVPGTADQLYFRMKQYLAYHNWHIEIEQSGFYRLQARFRYMDVSKADAWMSVGSTDRSKVGKEIHAALILEAKEGKIRYTFTDFREASLSGASTQYGLADATYIPLENAALSKGIVQRGGEVVPKFIEDLKIFMNVKYDTW